MSSHTRSIQINCSSSFLIGKGSQAYVLVGLYDGNICALKQYTLSDIVTNTLALRELKYQSQLSNTIINPLTMEREPCSCFNGVPRPLAFACDGQELILATTLLSRKTISQIVRDNLYMDLSRPLHAWIIQGIFALANAQTHEILHRDIKPEHLLVNGNYSLAIIDWGLSTKCPDNTFFTEYVTTYPYRPPEIFYHCMRFIQSNDLNTTPCEPYQRWPHITTRVRQPKHLSSTVLKPKSQHTRPYWCEADLYSLGMSFLLCLCQKPFFPFDPQTPFYHRQLDHMRSMFKFYGLWPSLIKEYGDPSGEPSYSALLAQHWREQFAARKQSVLCPFDSFDHAFAECPPKTLMQRLDSIKPFLYPSVWVHRFLDEFGPLLLAMIHPDPDERPNTLSLLKSVHESRRLDEWQDISREFFTHPARVETGKLFFHDYCPEQVLAHSYSGQVRSVDAFAPSDPIESVDPDLAATRLLDSSDIEQSVYNDQVDTYTDDLSKHGLDQSTVNLVLCMRAVNAHSE